MDFINVNEKFTGIIVGETGAGKTTLLNKICGTKEIATSSSGSVSRTLVTSSTCVGPAFDIIDTPGLDPTTSRFEHLYQVRHALTTVPINTIFYIAKYNNRFDKLKNEVDIFGEALANYKRKIVVVVTHFDASEDKEKDKREIPQELRDYCVGVIFCSKDTEPRNIAIDMDKYLRRMPAEELKIKENDFYLTFNLSDQIPQMRRAKTEHIKRIKPIVEKYQKGIELANNKYVKDKLDACLHSLIVGLKYELSDILEEFQKQHGKDMVSMDYYGLYIDLQKIIERTNYDFSKECSVFMSYSVNDTGDLRNLVKKCPNCPEIWIKTEGCDGTTHCGNAPENGAWQKMKRTALNFVLIKNGDKLDFEESENTRNFWASFFGLFRSEPVKPNSNVTEPKAKIKRAGCGARFVWGDQPRLSDELLLTLFQASSMAQIEAKLKGEEFQDITRNIDTTIYRK